MAVQILIPSRLENTIATSFGIREVKFCRSSGLLEFSSRGVPKSKPSIKNFRRGDSQVLGRSGSEVIGENPSGGGLI